MAGLLKMSSSCGSLVCDFLPHNLHATSAIPPIRMAPPIPPTTPAMTFLLDVLSPELPPPLPPFCRLGWIVEVASPMVDATVVLPTEVEVLTSPFVVYTTSVV